MTTGAACGVRGAWCRAGRGVMGAVFGAAVLGAAVPGASVLVAQASPTAAELTAKFERRVQEIAGHVDGVVGYVILDLTSGDRLSHLDRDVFPTASTIKLAIVHELFKQV